MRSKVWLGVRMDSTWLVAVEIRLSGLEKYLMMGNMTAWLWQVVTLKM